MSGKPPLAHDAGKSCASSLVFTAFFFPGSRAGGPIRSLDALTRHPQQGVDCYVFTTDRDSGDRRPYTVAEPLTWVSAHGRRILYVNTRSLTEYVRALWRLRGTPFSVYYFNSLWSRHFTIIPLLGIWIRLLPRRPIVLAPRGELLAGAMLTKSVRKRLFLVAYTWLLHRLGVVIHSTSTDESCRATQIFPKNEHFYIGDLFLPAPRSPAAVSIQYRPSLRIVYISRIHPHKNLLGAIRAVGALTIPVEFKIYGSHTNSDVEYFHRCRAAADDLPSNVSVTFGGHVDHAEVQERLAWADVLLLPTRSENFGHVIREGLAAGCLVLTSEGTPWTPILQSAGLPTPPWDDSESFSNALQWVASMTGSERHSLQRRLGSAYEEWENERKHDRHLMLLELLRVARQ
jgi:glycosyltransferase involved in cell wall biosynthesis